MKQNVHPAVVVTAILILVGVLTFLGYKVMNPDHSSSPSSEEMAVLQQKHMQQGQQGAQSHGASH